MDIDTQVALFKVGNGMKTHPSLHRQQFSLHQPLLI